MLDDTTVRLILAQKPPPHPPMGQGLFIHEVSRSQTTTHQRRQNSSGRVISSSQIHLPDNTQHSQQISMRPPVGIEPTILADERKRTYALDRAATVTGKMLLLVTLKQNCLVVSGLQALLCMNKYNNQQMSIKLLNVMHNVQNSYMFQCGSANCRESTIKNRVITKTTFLMLLTYSTVLSPS